MPVLNPSVSGQIASVVSPTFAGARDASSGTFSGTSSRYSEAIKYSKVAGLRGNSISINRYFIEFDTSGISVAPIAADLSLYGFTNSAADFFVVKANFSDGSIVNGDFDSIVGWTAGADNSSNVTKYSAEVETFSTSAFNDIALNSDALSDIANEDNFKLCLIQAENDLANNETTQVLKTGIWRTFNTIHLDYTPGAAAGYGHNVLGVASATIESVKGVATEDIAKVIGVD
jgi:hypothetical protein